MRRFLMNRKIDISGLSGTGIVADGVQFSDEQVVLSWRGRHHCISVWPSIEDMIAIHGHEGATEIEWID